MKTMSRALIPALGLMLIPTAAYAGDTFEPTADDDPALVKAWSAWDKKDIDDYTTTVALSCFCPQEPVVRTVVRDGEIRKVLQGSRRLGHGRGYSMDDLYLMLRAAHEDADRVEVTYTPRGVPKTISIDPEKLATDEETYYTVSLVRS